jgi:uncharacterized protein YbjT (DUF2867 family)
MKILISAPNGRTGRHIVAALRERDPALVLRGVSRSPAANVDDAIIGDMDDPSVRLRAVEGVDMVIHYGPPFHPRETSMGTGMIDAAKQAGVRRFIFVSVIHPEIDDLMNHKAKLAIEAHLINSGLDWTVLRPQHYMQSVDVLRAIREGRLVQPYPPEAVLDHVDMNDMAAAAAKVATEAGHIYATYDLSANEPLSVQGICDILSRISGRTVEPVRLDPAAMVEMFCQNAPRLRNTYSIEARHRLIGYYTRVGIFGNSNVLTWLLGRKPGSYEAHVRRLLQGNGR